VEKLSAEGLWAPLAEESIPVIESLGRVTSAPVSAAISSPFYHASAMDGYAVRFNDTFGASETSPIRLKVGKQAIYVDTGDPIPELEADSERKGDPVPFNAVIMVEDVNISEDYIEIIVPATPWQNVRTVGEDIVATELIAPENHRIRPVDIGAMLAGGITVLKVRRRPRVAIIPTGTEIVEPGGELKRGDIIEFNSRVLEGLAAEWGSEPLRHAIVPDDPEKLKEALLRAAEKSDMVAVIAGASAGTEDYTEQSISELGELILHGIAIKPGKPAMLGLVKGTPVVGLPGYPVASHLCFNLLARPYIMRRQGLEDSASGHGTVSARLSRQVASALGSEEFLRVKVGRVGDNLIATPLGRGAGLMMSLVRADGLLTVPSTSEGLAAGAEVEVKLMRSMEEIENTIVSIGSHDNSLDILANFLRKRYPRYTLSSAHVGSMGGLMALRKDEAHIAPTHMLDEETGEYNVPFIKRLLPGREITLVNLVHRTQGLMVAKGNPREIEGLSDIRRPEITFINRQRGAGTRLLLDKTLKELGINPEEVSGYGREEYTHMSVASAVLTGVADTGLGVLSAANALGLDFIPVASERYDLAIPTGMLGDERVKALMDIIRSDMEFRGVVEALGGYDASEMGKVMYEG
jgi:putative molybdopterin biosynthesis protein